MSVNKPSGPALILIDIQKGFANTKYWGGQRNNPDAEFRAGELLSVWRDHGFPIFHVQHCSTIPSSPLHETHPGNQFNELVTPGEGEPVIKKKVNSAFIGTDLQAQLERAEITTLVIAGLTTDHCISTTVRMAGNLGFETYLVAAATATFEKKGINGQIFPAELIHQTALASLDKEFATVIRTDVIKQEDVFNPAKKLKMYSRLKRNSFLINLNK